MWYSVIVILVILLICRNCCKNYSYLFIYFFCIVSVFVVVVVVVSYWSCKLVILVYFTISCIFCVVNKRLKKRGLGSTMKSSKNFVEDALHVARIQNPNSRVSGTAGSVMIIVILIQECSRLKKTVWREKIRLTSSEVWAMMTSKAWRDSARASFSPSRSRRRQKEALLSDCWKSWEQHNENSGETEEGIPKKRSH